MDAFTEYVTRDSAEEGQHADIAGGNGSGAREQQNQYENCAEDRQEAIPEVSKVRHSAK